MTYLDKTFTRQNFGAVKIRTNTNSLLLTHIQTQTRVPPLPGVKYARQGPEGGHGKGGLPRPVAVGTGVVKIAASQQHHASLIQRIRHLGGGGGVSEGVGGVCWRGM